MARKWSGKWSGGRTYETKDGRTVFVLRKLVDGTRYEIALDAATEREASAELALFMRSPAAYRPRGDAAARVPDAPVTIDSQRVARFLVWLRGEQGRTPRYVKNVGFYLAAWAGDLAGRDLRTVKLQDVLRVLGSYPRSSTNPETGKVLVQAAARRNRVTALKSFTAWLREVDASLQVGEDCTLALKVPPPRPEKARRAAAGESKGYQLEDVERLYSAITGWESRKFGWKAGQLVDVQPVRDVLRLHCTTGMHATEIERLARREGTLRRLQGQGEIAATITFVHKSGRVHVQSVDAATAAAVERLQARGSAPVDSFVRKVVARAAAAAKLPGRIKLGALRHSFVTWSRTRGRLVTPTSAGVALEAVAAAIGHQSTRTTSMHYDETRVPPMVVVPIKLGHRDDPT